jgi:hypothetical protein
MAATVRWVVEHPGHESAAGGWVEYPDQATAEQHAGTAATVWALVPPEVVRVLEAAQAQRDGMRRPEISDEQIEALLTGVAAAVDAFGAITPAASEPARDRPAGDTFAAIVDAHPLTLQAEADGLRPICGCGHRGEWTQDGGRAIADHAAHVHVAAGLAAEEDA